MKSHDAGWIHVVQDGKRWRVFVNAVVEPRTDTYVAHSIVPTLTLP
jgi:hypothetical protein